MGERLPGWPSTRAATRRSRRHHRIREAGRAADDVVYAVDDPGDLTKPRGKQDWQLNPHAIWYPRTTGIWQPVWKEGVRATHLRPSPLDAEHRALGDRLRGWLAGSARRWRLSVKLYMGDTLIADDTYTVVTNEVHRRIALSDPGIDDYRNELLWSPATPTLIHAELKLTGGRW